MRIALISFEFPPAVAIGGIGAYASEATRMLTAAGHEVEVFAAGNCAESALGREGALVHRIVATDRKIFREAVLPIFAQHHRHRAFEVMESPEVGAEALHIAEAFPEIALVVKLHTPSYLIGQLTYEAPSPAEHLRFALGALRRGRWARLAAPKYDHTMDPEAILTRLADRVAAPSQAIAKRVGTDWNLPLERLATFPLPYRPPESLTHLALPETVRTIGFLGRLEPRKGVIELTQAMPQVLSAFPDIRFRLLGPSWPYRRGDMQSWMLNKLGQYARSVEFVGAVSRENLATELEKCDAIVLPSRWESFGYACLESMAAGRVVIGSQAGGMADFILPGKNGYLVPPFSPEAISNVLCKLVGTEDSCAALAAAGRQSVIQMLAPSTILPWQVGCYETAIEQAKAKRLVTRVNG